MGGILSCLCKMGLLCTSSKVKKKHDQLASMQKINRFSRGRE